MSYHAVLKAIYMELYPAPAANGDGVVRYADLARRLSKIARKQPAWTWRYIESVAKGTIQASVKLQQAIDLLAASLDGARPEINGMQAVQVFAWPGTVKENAIILSPSRPCADPACRINFVPVVPNQKYCPLHRRR